MPRPTLPRGGPRPRHIPARGALFASGLFLVLTASAPLAAAPVPRELAPEPLFLGQAASAPPVLAFEPDAVVASGLEPDREVIFHGVSREHQVYLWRIVQTREVVRTDATGYARLELPEGEVVAPRSIWTVVDPITGELHLASPDGFTPQEIPFPADGLGQSEAGAWRVLRTRFERMELLYVRPGEGAWWLVGVEGSGSDDDRREDSSLTVRLETARSLWGSETPPRGFRPGDVVVAVSLDTLAYFAARLVSPGPAH